MNDPDEDPYAPSRSDLVAGLTATFVFLLFFVPWLVKCRRERDESQAREFLRWIGFAQTDYHEAVVSGARTAENGAYSALTALMKGMDGAAPLLPKWPEPAPGTVKRKGYLFKVFQRETPQPSWCCYAWPAFSGPLLYTDESGRLWSHPNADSKFAGVEEAPPEDAFRTLIGWSQVP